MPTRTDDRAWGRFLEPVTHVVPRLSQSDPIDARTTPFPTSFASVNNGAVLMLPPTPPIFSAHDLNPAPPSANTMSSGGAGRVVVPPPHSRNALPNEGLSIMCKKVLIAAVAVVVGLAVVKGTWIGSHLRIQAGKARAWAKQQLT